MYGQNYKGLYCTCSRPYPDPDCPPELEGDEMIQCIMCEDWFHGTCLKVDKTILDSDDTGELICFQCIQKYEILQIGCPRRKMIFYFRSRIRSRPSRRTRSRLVNLHFYDKYLSLYRHNLWQEFRRKTLLFSRIISHIQYSLRFRKCKTF